jgi:hypothetical protein
MGPPIEKVVGHCGQYFDGLLVGRDHGGIDAVAFDYEFV